MIDLDRVRSLVPERQGTHYERCANDHIGCALLALADEVEQLRAGGELSAAVAQLSREVRQLETTVLAMLSTSSQRTRAAVAAALDGGA